MDSGLASLLGAVVGGAATFGGVWLNGHQQAKKDRRREDREAAERGLAAARVLQAELAWAEARAEQALSNGRYWSARYAAREGPWEELQGTIAVSLHNANDWSTVRDGFRAIRTIELQASKRRRDDLSRTTMSDWGRDQLSMGLERIRDAIEALRPLAQDRARASMSQDPGSEEAEPAI